MAKRFLDTSFFKSPFVRGLKGAYKGLYLFIICDCEGSGIWSADFDVASLYVGQKVDKSGFEKFFVGVGKAIDLQNGKYFIPDFIEHQYPGGLSYSNIAHKNFILELTKYQLLDEDLKPLQSPFKGAKVMVKEKVKVNRAEILKFIPPTLEEVEAFFVENKNTRTQAKKAFDYYSTGSPAWTDSKGSPVRSWKQKMLANWIDKVDLQQNGHSEESAKTITLPGIKL